MAVPEYQLGVDLGTTFTAAAVLRNGRVEPVVLGGSRGAAIPTVVYLAGGEMQVGAEAVRRATTEPALVAREFKRRVGDPTPILVGGVPVAAERLMARLLSWVVEQVSATEGGPPGALAVTHPANWGEHKREVLREAIRHEGVRLDRLVPEPVAAACHYAAQRRLAPGSVVAVYDLGGGTFDAAIVEVEEPTFAIRGRPDGIERLGGIDFDHAVFGHVLQALQLDADALDPDDPSTVAAVARLRQSCVDAKEALTDADEATIPVMLPDRHTQVRLTRGEFEGMIRPALDETVVALCRTVDSAGITVDDLTAVLLVGGSSRIPLVERLITAELGRPVATDARPKDAISMGAAFVVSRAEPPPARPAVALDPGSPPPPVPAQARPGTPLPSSGRPPRRRRLAPLLVGLVSLLGAGVIGVLATGRDNGKTDTLMPVDDGSPSEDNDRGAPSTTGSAGTPPVTNRSIAETYDLSNATFELGWLDTTDQFIMANITAHALEEAGATVGADGPAPATGAETLRDQLVGGEIDLFWDYVGRPAGINDFDLPPSATPQAQQDQLNDLDATNDLVWLEPTAHTRGNGLAMRREDAQRLGISSIADIASLIDDDPSAATACFVFEDQLQGLEASYRLEFTAEIRVNLPEDVYSRLVAGLCTFGEVPFAIHPAMVDFELVVLDDNRGYYTPMNAAPRLRSEVLDAQPEIEDLLSSIAQALDNATMAELVARVEVDGELAADVALDWLQDNGMVER
jgi:molecular chaperone DnaK